ncbi:NACHT domain-containing protein [Amycolatopsis sp. NPDC004079]|uniref:NACHT domain-containing protein n=1 Tax=Amycolatopsis sp. NPDC004079 TaxID=3154549 RepID=UPI0033A0CC8C
MTGIGPADGHYAIVVVDIKEFSRFLTRPAQIEARTGVYRALETAFDRSGVPWDKCPREDRGDGVLILIPGQLSKNPLAAALPDELARALGERNGRLPEYERIQLRVAMHAGEVAADSHGYAGTAINLAFRLVNSAPLRGALDKSSGVVALAVSAWFYDEVVQHIAAARPKSYRRVRVENKETRSDAWISRPDDSYPDRTSDSDPIPDRNFEERYVDFVREDNAGFELFKVARRRGPADCSFDKYYVVPPVTRRQTAVPDPELTGAGTDSANAIADARRVLLLGGAGAGKTTFLAWLANDVARRHDEEGPWRGVVPFPISLRLFAETDLPKDPELLLGAVAPTLAEEKPEGWAAELFASGRAMLLVDGLDELVADRRASARQWVETLVLTYPDARCVVSTRPSAVDDQWFVETDTGIGLERFELPELSRLGLGRVIGRWFAAAADQEPSAEQRELLRTYPERLRTELEARPNLRGLVSSPLMAGLLCALYREDQYLPRTRRELLDQAIDLLLTRWDDTAHRGMTVVDGVDLVKAEKQILLERFASAMVRRNELLVPRSEALDRLDDAKKGLRAQDLSSGPLLQHLLERSVLRESPADRQIQFIHRTFRDYLAAADLVKRGQLDELAGHAHEDYWYEVVFMAAARAREGEVAELLGNLLRRARRSTDKAVADRLKLVAAACLEYADVVDPHSQRVEVEAAARQLLPPVDVQQAEMLAKAGRFVVGLLPGPDELTGPNRDTAAAAVLRTLALVGGEEAWQKIRPFTAMHQSTVVNELLRGWRAFDFSEAYAAELLSKVDFGDLVLNVHRWGMLPRLRHLATLRAVKMIGDMALVSDRDGLRPLAAVPQLRRLEIASNEVIRDLRPLADCAALRVLTISAYSALRDLSGLSGSSVEKLRLLTIGKTVRAYPALGTLAGTPLRSLSLRHPGLSEGLHPIPAGLALTELAIHNRPESRSLLGIERLPSLEKVTVSGVLLPDEVEALGELPALSRLVLRDPYPLDDLALLRPLADRLHVLELRGVDQADARIAAKAVGDELAAKLRN